MNALNGYKIVLTADRTLMSKYQGGIFLGFSACIPRGLIPDFIYFYLFCPSVEAYKNGAAAFAPCGTRKIESALLNYGFKKKDIIVAHPEHLDKVIGSNTKVLGITENDPLGMGPATTTFTQLFGGEAYMAIKFKELLNNPSVKKFKPRIIVGGQGAWQLEDEYIMKKLGIDCVVIGEGEEVVGKLFEKAINGEPLPPIVYGEIVPEDKIPTIQNPTIHGIVEIARGCGRGCAFCIPTLQRFRCIPVKRILEEIKINLKAGEQPLLHAEDVLRYKAKGLKIDKEAVVELFKTVKNYPGVKSISISHFALSSVASAPDLVEEISRILKLGEESLWLSGQTGIETGSPRMIKDHMAGKCKPFRPEDWPNVVINAFEILSSNKWVPAATIILGLPGEQEKDIELTIKLIEKLKKFKSLIVPLFYVSGGIQKNKTKSFMLEDLTIRHSELIIKCWEHNFNWIPILLKEYSRMSIKRKSAAYGLKVLASYSIKIGRKLIDYCKKEYSYNLLKMIKDFKANKISETPRLLKIMSLISR
jgi:radical SAM superfamily enzyme YgiQ (UPF0313 family)